MKVETKIEIKEFSIDNPLISISILICFSLSTQPPFADICIPKVVN